MAEKKTSVSQSVQNQFTGAKTQAAQDKISSLQAQIQSATEASKEWKGGGFVNPHQLNLNKLNSQLSAQQAIVADPTSVMSAREKDIVKGAQFGEAIIGDGLGRLGTDENIQGMLAQQAELAKGMSSQEMLARQERAKEGLAGQAQSQSRALQARLGAAGVKGAQAGQQLGQIQAARMAAEGNLERDLMIQDRSMRQQGLANQFEATMAVQQFDISQAAKEKDIALQAGLGFAGLGAQERGTAAQAAATRAAASARHQRCHLKGTLVKLEDGSYKEIEKLVIGDRLSTGIVEGIGQATAKEKIYEYKGEFMTASHNIEINGKMVAVAKLPEAKLTNLSPSTIVYPLIVDSGKYETIANFISGDVYSVEAECEQIAS